ncbi:MAG: ATP-binding protein [Elusimicrobiota bacterium]|jgi:PAS domain S-box-containing protein
MKLQTKILGGLLVLQLLSFLPIVYFSQKAVHAVLIDELTQLSLSKSSDFGVQASAGVAAADEKRLLPILQDAAKELKASYVLALDPSGRVLAHTNVVEAGRIYDDPQTRAALSADKPLSHWARYGEETVLDLAIPVWVRDDDFLLAHEEGGGRRLGALRVGLPLRGVVETDRRILGRIALIMLLAGACMLVAVRLLLRRTLSPIRELAESVSQVGHGRYGLTVPIHSRDEVGELARTFNRMSVDLDRTLRSIVDIVLVADAQGSIRVVNQVGTKLLGYAEEELLGRPIHALFEELLPQSPVGKSADILASIVAGRMPAEGMARDIETLMIDKIGKRIPVLLAASAMTDGSGGAAGVILIAKDLSERRKMEMMLRHSEKIAAVGRLAGGVAHDFNNILTAVTGYANFLLESLPKGSENHDDVLEIKKAAARASTLTRQMLAFSRKQVLQAVVLDLNALLTNTAKMLRTLVGEDIALTMSLDPELGRVKADAGQVEQVVINLVINARDAMPHGGKIAIETRNMEFAQAQAHTHGEIAPGRYAMIAITDTGEGMSKETQTHLFEPFFTTKERGKGTGLGLATSHGIVLQSGGSVAVYSELNRGTTFKVYLPLTPEVLREGSPFPAPAEVRRGDETILLVEDDQAAQAVARRTLEGNGYRVLAADDGAAALLLYQEHRGSIHLLLTDVVMPGMTGLELARRVLAEHPGLPVLYMSGYTEHAAIQEELLASRAFIQKPFSPDSLAAKVHEVLAAHHASTGGARSEPEGPPC